MGASWESGPLRDLPVDPAALAEQVATDLCDPGDFVVQLLFEYLVALDASLALQAPALLADQLRWQRTRLAVVAPELTRTEVAAAVRSAVAAHLTAGDLDAVDRHVEHASRAALAAPDGDGATPMLPLARSYLEHVLRGDRDAAVAVVTGAVQGGMDVADVLLTILQPVQIEIGRLWETGRVSVAHEHFSTAVTQLCLSMLYPHLAQGRVPLGRTLVAAGAETEGHEVGLRIVADLIEAAGWRTSYLGVGVPVADVVEACAEQQADVLAVSATTAAHVPAVRRLVAAVRADERLADLQVVVGGRPFELAPDLAASVGADGWAPDPASALALCNRLVEQRLAHSSGAVGSRP